MAKKQENVQRILNVLPSPKPEQDWTFETSVDAGILAAPQIVPASLDLREDWWEIGNQGGTGSCVGWATADSLLRWHFVKGEEIQQGDHLSVRFIWMAAKETDEFQTRPTTFIEPEGTSLKAALDVARNYGAVPISALPFDSGKLFPQDAKVFYALASRLKIANYFNLGIDATKWRMWLATSGPILVRLDVDDTWGNAASTGGNLDEYHHPSEPAGHAVTLVGYTPDRFIVRNSWGTSWGDKGFGYASLSYGQNAFTEAYGISL